MPSHPELARAFRGGLSTGVLPPGLTARDPDEADRRFAVYRNNVAHSLTDALAGRFPVVRRLVGEAFFRAMARVFIEVHPPASPVLLAWGDALPVFLEGFPPVQSLPYLPDMARLELARGRAYHAADGDPLPAEALVRAAQDPAETELRPHASVQLVASRFAIVSIWRANQPQAKGEPVRAGGAETALVLRDRSFNVPVRAVRAGDAAFLTQLRSGASLLSCASAGLLAEPGHDSGALLAQLAGAGALISCSAEDQP